MSAVINRKKRFLLEWLTIVKQRISLDRNKTEAINVKSKQKCFQN